MKLIDLEIRNLKSITKAHLHFQPKPGCQISLLYGDNGAGKTTILEAISLIGHLSTMRRIFANPQSRSVEVRKSRYREFKEQEQGANCSPATTLGAGRPNEDFDPNAFRDQCELIEALGLEKWWENTTFSGGKTTLPARLRYCVQFNQDTITFYVSFLQAHDLSITEALSRDQNGPGERIHDWNMDNWFAVVCSLESKPRLEALIEHMRLVSPHSYRNAEGHYVTDSRTDRRPLSKEIVAYWNTDLNDFGRKNDLRESVKKIRLDFRDQMITRLGIALPIGPPEHQRYYAMNDREPTTGDKLETVNESLRNALIDHSIAMQRERKKIKEGLVRLSEITVHPGDEPATMKARRAGEKADIEIDHLSAGENESVFIFLLMHGMPCRESIILLDEPDLHLSDFARPRFYAELYRIGRLFDCQLIISTHSAVAYTKAGHLGSQHFIRREVEENPDGIPTVIYKTDWEPDFGELLTFHYARCAVNAMSQAGWAWRVLSWPVSASIRLGEWMGVWAWSLFTFTIAFFALYSGIASLADFRFMIDKNATWHRHFIMVALFVCVVLWLLSIAYRVTIIRRRKSVR